MTPLALLALCWSACAVAGAILMVWGVDALDHALRRRRERRERRRHR